MAKSKTKTAYGILTEIYNADPSRTQPGKTDWGVKSYDDLNKERDNLLNNIRPDDLDTLALKNGTLLTVFNTVAKGETLWEGTIELERDRNKKAAPMNPNYKGQVAFGMWVHGFQKDMEPEEWASMFFERFPAKLEKDGKVIYGSLDPFFETGTEGVLWAVSEYGIPGYGGLNVLKDGDKLTVYKNVTDGDIAWQGRLSFDENQNVFKVHNGTMDVHTKRTPKHIEPQKWQQMYWDRHPVKIEP